MRTVAASTPEPFRALLRPPRHRFRVLTRRRRMLPDFLVLGAQRAGTTTFLHHLRRHPDIRGPGGGDRSVYWPKELHFFDERFGMGIEWYRSFFPLEATRTRRSLFGGTIVAGEGTPSYLFHPLAPERAARTVPDAKLIALLRDPVARAHSHYQLSRRAGREQLEFEEALAAEEKRLARERKKLLENPDFRPFHHRNHSYVSRGLYAEQLERWFAHFTREQVLVLSFEEFAVNPVQAYDQVVAFLGVRSWDAGEFVPLNIASYDAMDPEVRTLLEKRFAEPNRRLARLLGRDFGWSDSSRSSTTLTVGVNDT